jgi:hypothetical protein
MNTPQPEPTPEPTPVHIVAIKIPFWSMVVLMVKWSIAAIPAALILFFLYLAVVGSVVGILNHLYR